MGGFKILSLTFFVAAQLLPAGQVDIGALGGEYPLVGDINGHQQQPSIAIHAEGGAVVWQNATSESGGERIVIQMLSVDYQGLGTPQIISQNITGQNDLNPSVAILPGGSSVVIWESGPRASRDIFIRFVGENGRFNTEIMQVNSFDSGIQSNGTIAVSTEGEVLVVWSSNGQDGAGEGVYGQYFNSQGVRVGGEFRVNQNTAKNQSCPRVAFMGGRRFVVAWVGESINGTNSSGAPNLRSNVYGRIISSDGQGGNEYQLNAGDVVAQEVTVAGMTGEGFVVGWSQKDELNTRNISDIYARKFGSNGLPVEQGKKINTFLPGVQGDPSLAVLGDQVMINWSSVGQDSGGVGVRGRMYEGGAEFGVNTQENLDQSMPALAPNGSGEFVAVWVNTIRADHSILSAQRFAVHEEGTLFAASDITAGTVEVVGNAPVQRQTNPSAVAKRVVPKDIVSVATMQIAPPAPVAVVETVAPSVSVAAKVVQALNTQTIEPSAVSSVSESIPESSPDIKSGMTSSVPSVSSAANMALNNISQYRAGGVARYNVASTRSYITPVRQQASSQTGYSPSRSSMMLGSTFSRNRPSSLRISSGGDVRLGGAQVQRIAADSVSNARGQASASAPVATASERVTSLRTSAQASAAMARNSSQTPVPAGVVRTGRGTNLQWISKYGGRYQVQSSNDKVNWNDVSVPRKGTSGVDAISVGNLGFRFYRVVRVN